MKPLVPLALLPLLVSCASTFGRMAATGSIAFEERAVVREVRGDALVLTNSGRGSVRAVIVDGSSMSTFYVREGQSTRVALLDVATLTLVHAEPGAGVVEIRLEGGDSVGYTATIDPADERAD